jgi:hypothetical protein
MPHLQIEIHVLHPSPSAESKAKGYLLLDFYSGATGLPGRFDEGLLLRRLEIRGAGIVFVMVVTEREIPEVHGPSSLVSNWCGVDNATVVGATIHEG